MIEDGLRRRERERGRWVPPDEQTVILTVMEEKREGEREEM